MVILVVQQWSLGLGVGNKKIKLEWGIHTYAIRYVLSPSQLNKF